MLQVPTCAMSTSSDCNLITVEGEDSDSVFLSIPPASTTPTCSEPGGACNDYKPGVGCNDYKPGVGCNDYKPEVPGATHVPTRPMKSRNNSTNSSRRSSQKRKGSQKHHRNPSRKGSNKDKKRLLSQKSDCSSLPDEPENKHRKAVRVIFTVSVILILMSVIIVATTLMMSGKFEEMVKNKVKPSVKSFHEGTSGTNDVTTKAVTHPSSAAVKRHAHTGSTILSTIRYLTSTSSMPQDPKHNSQINNNNNINEGSDAMTSLDSTVSAVEHIGVG